MKFFLLFVKRFISFFCLKFIKVVQYVNNTLFSLLDFSKIGL